MAFERERTTIVLYLIVLLIIADLITAKEKDLCNNTNKGKYCKCTQCSKTGSTGSCSYQDYADATSVLCVCKEGYIGSLCNKCDNGWYSKGNVSEVFVTCVRCNCSGHLHVNKRNICDRLTGTCNICLPNATGGNCEECTIGPGGVNCSASGIESYGNHEGTSHRDVKDAIIITVCTIIGILCITATAYLVYRHRRLGSIKGRIPKYFWTVELSNRNFDDLDFSLLDPVSDTPFVYRNDTNDFEEALIPEEKPQLRLHMDVLQEEDFSDPY